MNEIVAWIGIVLSVVALVVSFLSWQAARRSAVAAEDSARQAGRANEIALFGHLQKMAQNFQAEIARARSDGNDAQIKALEFAHGTLLIEALKKAVSEADETAKEKFVEYFSGIAARMPNDKVVIEQLVAHVLAEEKRAKE